MLKTTAFIIYSAAIPLVPLYGTVYYRDKNKIKRLCCWGLFAVQSLISLGSILSWLGY